ncbi:MAG TPA: 1-acyl-sn-glycerol-3-phosphate acyltransferase [Xanthobacteraceae bacterium]|nr:1-acyl-sn-glycerol-3-phosphate acyltransferase [Xanthobacteraceae bacterium]
MSSTVTLPLWIVAALLALAIIAVLDRLLVPSVRWALRRRANRAIDRMNTRLRMQIQPFKLTRRQVLIDQLVYDPEVLHAVEQYAKDNKVPREVAAEKVKRYAREIVPSFSAYAYFGIGTRLARVLSESLYRVRVGYRNDEALAHMPPGSSVVAVINHRSNMDYVLVTYLAATASALSYAVGEWAQILGLRELIRSMGAYFIRRNSRDALYRKVLGRYVHMATAAGVVQAVFPEGGLSRDGRLRPPKLGLLSYMVSGFDPQGPRDVMFVPVGLNYDRVLEDRLLTAAVDPEPGQRPFGVNAITFARYFLEHLWMTLRGHWHRFGYTCVSFGEPISLRAYLAERGGIDFRTMTPEARHAEIDRLGHKLMAAVGRVVPALPVSLVATAMVQAGAGALTLLEIKERVSVLIHQLEASGAYVHIPRADRDYAIDLGLRILTERGIVVEEGGSYHANPNELILLEYYANAIAHLFTGAPPAETAAGPKMAAPLRAQG